MEHKRSQAEERRLDLAARAAWLYYIGGNTQDEIAAKLSLSRQAAQRLVSLAVTEKLIKFRLDHPVGPGHGAGAGAARALRAELLRRVPVDPATASPIRRHRHRRRRLYRDLAGTEDAAGPRVLDRADAARRDQRDLPARPARSTASSRWSARCRATAGRARSRCAMRLAERIGAQCFLMSAAGGREHASRSASCCRPSAPIAVVRELAAARRRRLRRHRPDRA